MSPEEAGSDDGSKDNNSGDDYHEATLSAHRNQMKITFPTKNKRLPAAVEELGYPYDTVHGWLGASHCKKLGKTTKRQGRKKLSSHSCPCHFHEGHSSGGRYKMRHTSVQAKIELHRRQTT
ncbi:hypothetical protein PHMEG_00038632 [Phytophthora megakarya]|uniref:Uncharacterized protein n=1 Tax=Phytophthora megakarya TaxID=4795 RepID=A0A225UHE4_9STRA|nr:hypothetical protein PHMEG_00038632 [Phytophthora megakarya]